MKKGILKRKLLILSIATGIVALSTREKDYHPDYEVFVQNENKGPFARYSKGDVYIGSVEYIELIQLYKGDQDILIIDERYRDDPNFKVVNSYLVNNKEEMNEILEILTAYEIKYPSNWNRTIESMRNEFVVHNFCYQLHYRLDSTVSVDFNNEDEEKYDSKILTKILWN